MKAPDYPKKIAYEVPRNFDFTPEFYDLWRKVTDDLRMTMLDENVLQIEYPSELVKQIRTVNVDDCIFRLDFVLIGHDTRVCVFPNVPWKRENFFINRRICNGKREEAAGKLTLIYPKIEKE